MSRTALAIVFFLLGVAFAIVGTMDFHEDQQTESPAARQERIQRFVDKHWKQSSRADDIPGLAQLPEVHYAILCREGAECK